MLDRILSQASFPGSRRARRVRQAGALLALGVVVALGGCAIPFGGGEDSAPAPESPESARERRRERNRMFLEEQERMERSNQFDRVGPPSDR